MLRREQWHLLDLTGQSTGTHVTKDLLEGGKVPLSSTQLDKNSKRKKRKKQQCGSTPYPHSQTLFALTHPPFLRNYVSLNIGGDVPVSIFGWVGGGGRCPSFVRWYS